MNARHAGFTIIELMVTIAVVAILASVAAPSMRDLIRSSRMTSLTNDLMTDLSVARSEAVKRGMRTAVCPSTNGTSCSGSDWYRGWIVFVENPNPSTNTYGTVDSTDTVLKAVLRPEAAAEADRAMITSVGAPGGSSPFVGFRPSGVISAGGFGANVVFQVCDARNLANVSADAAFQRGRLVTLTNSGRASASRCTCQSDGTTCQ